MTPDREPVELIELADRLVRATSVVLAVVAIVLLAFLAFGWTFVPGSPFEPAPDPAATMPF